MTKLARDREREILREAKTCKGVVLDIGCGTGQLSTCLSETSEFVVGLDIQRTFHRRYISKVNFVIGDALNLPFREGTFDAVTAFDVIEHLINGSKFLREVNRVLKPKGIFLITTPNRDRLNLKLLSLIGRRPIYPRHMGKDPEVGNVTHTHEYSKSELCRELDCNGFAVTKISGIYFGIVYGFPPKIEIGIKRFPRFLEKFASLLIAKAQK